MTYFDEAKEVMGGEWSKGFERDYGITNSFQALDMYFLDYVYNGEETKISEVQEPLKYIKSVANMSDADLLAWVNKQTMAEPEIINKAAKKPMPVVLEYENFARDCRDKCRAYLGKNKLKEKLQ